MRRRSWQNLPLGNLFAIAAMILVFASNTLISLFFLRYEAQRTREMTYANARASAVQVSVNVDDLTRSILNKIVALRSHDQFSYSSPFGKFIFHEEAPYYALALSDLSKALAEIRSSEPFIYSIYIYTPKGEFSDFIRLRRPGVAFTDTALYRRFVEGLDVPIVWGGLMKDELFSDGKEVIPIVYPFKVEGYTPSCYFVVYLDAQRMTEYLQKLHSGEKGGILVFGPGNEALVASWTGVGADPASDLVGQLGGGVALDEVKVLSARRGNYLVAAHPTVIAPWKVLVVNSEEPLRESLHRAGLFVALITVFAMLACLAAAVPLSRAITRPLTQLEGTVRKVADHDFDIRVDYDYDNEVGNLARNINVMIERIKDLVDARNATIEDLRREKELVRTEQGLKRQAELRALQAQINPHFLYNTLNTISWLADQSKVKDIGRMVENLGRLFQISLNDGREVISVAEELEHTSRYLEIQKARYGDSLRYQIDVDGSLRGRRMIKLILQPFVENAIVHGIRGVPGGGTVSVLGRLDEEAELMVFTVEDDGAGMEQLTLKVVRARLRSPGGGVGEEDAEGYGIYNVNERIKLYYGADYGVDFESVLGRGTVATIRLPAAGFSGGDPWKRTAY